MKLPWLFARRYLVSKKSTNAINVISAVSGLGMFVGSLGLVLVLSVFNGFQHLVEGLYSTFTAPVVILPSTGKTFMCNDSLLQKIKAVPHVAHYSRVIEENALLRWKENQDIATVKGVDDNYAQLTGVDSSLWDGDFQLMKDSVPMAIVGVGIQQKLRMSLDDPGGVLSIYMPRKGKKIYFNPMDAFNTAAVGVSASFAIQQDFDTRYVLVPFTLAQQLTGNYNKVSSIEIMTDDAMHEQQVIDALGKMFGRNLIIKNRFQQNDTLYKVMRTEKWAVYAILTFILIVAAFNMIGSLSMLVIEKRKDISILKTMGASEGLIKNIFLGSGMLLSMLACVAGFIVAVILILLQQHFGFIQIGGASFVVSAYPVRMQWQDFVLVFTTVAIIGSIASWLPAIRAAKNELRMKEE